MDLRVLFFKYRSYTPIPLLLAILIFAAPSSASLVSGFAVTLLGQCLRLWAVSHAGGATRTTGTVGAGAELITHGPFAYVRNPLYLGNFLIALGFCLMAWAGMPWLLLIFLALFGLQYQMIISLEEEHLRQRFGKIYNDYLAQVPRFVPRFTPFRPQSTPGMPLARALRIEKDTLLSTVLISLAIFLRWKFATNF
jgi:protein-S-isoprenylcysteine O-methyltransferase Ste14